MISETYTRSSGLFQIHFFFLRTEWGSNDYKEFSCITRIRLACSYHIEIKLRLKLHPSVRSNSSKQRTVCTNGKTQQLDVDNAFDPTVCVTALYTLAFKFHFTGPIEYYVDRHIIIPKNNVIHLANVYQNYEAWVNIVSASVYETLCSIRLCNLCVCVEWKRKIKFI